jgi:hypothetical protein
MSLFGKDRNPREARSYIIDHWQRAEARPRYRKKMKYNPRRKEVEAAVEVYLKNGGKITKLEFGAR